MMDPLWNQARFIATMTREGWLKPGHRDPEYEEALERINNEHDCNGYCPGTVYRLDDGEPVAPESNEPEVRGLLLALLRAAVFALILYLFILVISL